MEKIDIGESILQHYEKFLGNFGDCLVFRANEETPSIQLLMYDNVFEGCKTYATLGLSKFFGKINNMCEIVLAIDDDWDNAATMLANSLFYVIQNGLNFGRGTYIEGIKSIAPFFYEKHKKNAIYFTETYMFPDEFSKVEDNIKMYMAFFVSEEECKIIREQGCEVFEEYLEKQAVDVMNLNR